MSDYIDNADSYSLLKKDRDYMFLVKKAYNQKIYSQIELQQALQNENAHPLSDVLRIAAYDEVKNAQKIELYALNIKADASLLEKFPPFALLISDALLRIGENEKVLAMLPRQEIVMLPTKQKQDAYYYRAMAQYLTDKTISQEFKMIMNHYKITKDIYYKKRAQK